MNFANNKESPGSLLRNEFAMYDLSTISCTQF